MSRTISANSSGVSLTSANPGDNPLIILAGIAVASGSNGVNADASQVWTITNQGTVSGYTGIRFAGGGKVTNSGTASAIAGSGSGIYAAGAATVTNQGSISGTNGFGVALVAGGMVTNLGTASHITGGSSGVAAFGAAATVTNNGTVSGTSNYGIYLHAGGAVTNAGTLSRVTGGIGITAGSGTVSNQGSVTATFDGVNLTAGGTVTNRGAGSSIAAGSTGVAISGGAGTVTNAGTISATNHDGVLLNNGGLVTNSGVASHIIGKQIGIIAGNAAITVVNQGTIIGTNFYGVDLQFGGMVTNKGTASSISGGGTGIQVAGPAAGITIVNGGTIAGVTAAVQFGNGGNNLLQVLPRAVFSGAVNAGSGSGDTLELGSSAMAGTISGIGSQFTGFEQLTVDAGATWQMAGANTIGAAMGVRLSPAAALKVVGTLTAPANLTLAGSGTLAAIGGIIEIGTDAAGLANQIRIDAGHTLSNRGVLSAGLLKVMGGGLLVGAGTVTKLLSNAGSVEAKGGVLTVGGNLTGAGSLQVDPGATLALGGAANTAASVLNKGTVALGGGDTLKVTGSVDPAGSGLFILNDASMLEVAADTGTGGKIQFLGPAGSTLAVDSAGQFGTNVGLASYAGPLLENFGGAGDAIDLKDLGFAGATIDSYLTHGTSTVVGVLQLHSGATLATLSFEDATLTGSGFQIANDGGGHVLLTHV